MAAVGGIPDSIGNRSVCLTGISKEESHAGKMEKTVVFRGRDESSQCFVYSPVPYGLFIWYILSGIQRVRA